MNCPICKHEIHDYGSYTYCTDFCAETTQKEKDEFALLKPGDSGCFPCTNCGVPLEGDFDPPNRCSTCSNLIRDREQTALLQEALDSGVLSEDLASRIAKALDK